MVNLLEPFPKKAEPYMDESFLGYMYRMVELNGYPNVQWALKRIDCLEIPTSYTLDKLVILSQLLQIDTAKLIALIAPSNEVSIKDVSELKNIHYKYGLNTKKVKVCPACMNEKQYYHKSWNIGLVTTCPIHRILLFDKCPYCNKKIRNYRRRLFYCNCGLDFRSIQVNADLEEDEVMLSKIISSKIMKNDMLLSQNLQTPLVDFSTEEIIKIIMFFAKYVNLNKDRSNVFRRLMSTNISNKAVHATFTSTSKLFVNWPENFVDFLKNYKGGNSGKRGIKSKFGDLYEQFEMGFSNEKYECLRLGFNIFFENYWEDKSLFFIKNRKNLNSRFVSRNEACILAGNLHVQKIDELIDRGNIEAKRIITLNEEGKDIETTLIYKESLENYLDSIKNSVTLKEAEKLLNISDIYIKELVERGLFLTTHGPINGYKYIRIKKSSIDSFLKYIEDITLENDDISEDYISLINAVTYANMYNYEVTIVSFVTDIHSKVFKKIQKNNRDYGLKGFYFSKNEIKERYCKHFLTPDVASIFKVKKQLVATWIKEGFINSYKSKGKHIISFKEAHDFETNYFTIAQLIVEEGYDFKDFSPTKINNIIVELSTIYELVYGTGRSTLFKFKGTKPNLNLYFKKYVK